MQTKLLSDFGVWFLRFLACSAILWCYFMVMKRLDAVWDAAATPKVQYHYCTLVRSSPADAVSTYNKATQRVITEFIPGQTLYRCDDGGYRTTIAPSGTGNRDAITERRPPSL